MNQRPSVPVLQPPSVAYIDVIHHMHTLLPNRPYPHSGKFLRQVHLATIISNYTVHILSVHLLASTRRCCGVSSLSRVRRNMGNYPNPKVKIQDSRYDTFQTYSGLDVLGPETYDRRCVLTRSCMSLCMSPLPEPLKSRLRISSSWLGY